MQHRLTRRHALTLRFASKTLKSHSILYIRILPCCILHTACCKPQDTCSMHIHMPHVRIPSFSQHALFSHATTLGLGNLFDIRRTLYCMVFWHTDVHPILHAGIFYTTCRYILYCMLVLYTACWYILYCMLVLLYCMHPIHSDICYSRPRFSSSTLSMQAQADTGPYSCDPGLKDKGQKMAADGGFTNDLTLNPWHLALMVVSVLRMGFCSFIVYCPSKRFCL